MAYTHLFFDLDHTLWDFETNAKQTMQELYEELHLANLGITDFELFFERYTHHNDRLWDRYRKGFMKRDELRWKRMWHTLLDFKIGNEPLSRKMDTLFLDKLPTRTALFSGAIEVLDYLQSKKYGLHMITNGFETVQHNKLKYSGLAPYFTHVITSEGSNSLKPKKEIFVFAMQKAGATVQESLMLGDDITADITGAMNAGMDQVFVNHKGLEPDIKPTYTISDLLQLKNIL